MKARSKYKSLILVNNCTYYAKFLMYKEIRDKEKNFVGQIKIYLHIFRLFVILSTNMFWFYPKSFCSGEFCFSSHF